VTRIPDILRRGRSVSVELWPPRSEEAEERLERALEHLHEAVRPTFCSVTYGAGGSTRERTHDLVARLASDGRMVPMAHLVCAAHSRAELAEILRRYREAGVENVLALKGDQPLDAEHPLSAGELSHAVELAELARSVGAFTVAVAAHPGGHPQSPDLETDRRFLAEKLSVADFAITQFFFAASDYWRLVDDLSRRGIDKPVVPGVMPITSRRSIARMAEMSGSPVPEPVARQVEALSGDPEAVRRLGVELAASLAAQLLDSGAPGLHFYTMNLSASTVEVCRQLGLSRAA
jgi:methylenetetrahydrofolate reductase (NADPH)